MHVIRRNLAFILVVALPLASSCDEGDDLISGGTITTDPKFSPSCGQAGDSVVINLSGRNCEEGQSVEVRFAPNVTAFGTTTSELGDCIATVVVPAGAKTGTLVLAFSQENGEIVTSETKGVYTIPCPDAGLDAGPDTSTGGAGGSGGTAGSATGGSGGIAGADASSGGTGGGDASTGGSDSGSGDSVPTGTFPAGTKNEGFTFFQGLTPYGSFPFLIAAQNGIHVIDFSASPPALLPPGSILPPGATSGIDLIGVEMLATVDGNKHVAVNSLMGYSGFRTWSFQANAWTNYFEDGSMSDVTVIGGGPQSTGFVGAMGDIALTFPSATAPGGWIAPPYIPVQGNVYSAYQHSPNGPILYVLNDTGQLGIITGTSPFTSNVVGNVGSDPRRLRYLNPYAVVTDFLSDLLTIVSWDGVSLAPTIVGTVPVGDGPVGIGLTSKPGQTWVASTGYNDNSFSVTVLDNATGTVVSNKKASVPAGCTQPGHADFVPAPTAPAGVRVAFTCYNGLYVVDVPP